MSLKCHLSTIGEGRMSALANLVSGSSCQLNSEDEGDTDERHDDYFARPYWH